MFYQINIFYVGWYSLKKENVHSLESRLIALNSKSKMTIAI